MYCKYCGELINNDSSDELEVGEHSKCSRRLQYCNYCGKAEIDRPHYTVNNGNYKLTFCQPVNKGRDNCVHKYFDEKSDSEFLKYSSRMPNLDPNLKDIFLNLVDEYNEGDVDVDQLINDINNHDGYILIFNDSDGRVWYDTVPNNIDTLKYIVKKEDRKVLGMGCNQYIDHILYQGKEFTI
jgi:hypothetical protein